MDEENMWKDMFEKLQVLKANPPTEHESRLQDADGGFFEKFGYLLRQKSHMEETNLKTSLAPFPEDCPNDTITVDNSFEPTEGACESVTVSPLVLEESSDIHDIESCKEKFIDEAIRMNVSY